MAIIYSYPDNANILLTDLLIGTSTVRIAGKKKNLTKNFTVEALGNFISLNNPTVWGTIVGNLQDQTDLWSALESKQGNITLTTNGVDGPSTFIADVLNIPDYSAGVEIPTLAQVLLAGNAATNNITLIGNVTASSFIKTGGTNLQYLMADGSVSLGPTIVQLLTEQTIDSYIGSRLRPTNPLSNGFYVNRNVNGAVGITGINTSTGNAAVSILDVGIGAIYTKTAYIAKFGANYYVPLLAGKGGLLGTEEVFVGSTDNNDVSILTGTTFTAITRKFTVKADGQLLVQTTPTTGTTSDYILLRDTSGNVKQIAYPTIPTIGTWGELDYPIWTAGTPFVKMTAAGTFALDTNTYLTGITSSDVTTALGYTPVTNARTLTINGVGYDLTADRSWTISTSTSPLTTKGDLYTFNTVDARLPIGLDTQVLLADSSTATGLKWGTNTAPTPLGYYLSISDSTGQTNPTANTPRAVKFNTIDLANGFSLQTETAVFTGTINNGGAGAGTILNVTGVASGTLKVGMVLTGGSITAGTFISAFTSGTGGIGTYEVSVSQNRASATYTGTMTSEIVCANTGVYNIQFSSQMDKSDGGVDYVNFWLRKNGADLPESTGVISLQGSAPAYMMAAWNYLVQLVAGDVIELYWGSADVNMEIRHEPAQTSPFAHPAIQSTILTITQQSGIMAGTGITAINSLTGAAQTLATNGSGTDFNISSVGTTHTFNLPTASATNRGALSTTDWSTFNNKANANTELNIRRTGYTVYNEFLASITNGSYSQATVLAGTITSATGNVDANHFGVVTFNSSVTANSGFYSALNPSATVGISCTLVTDLQTDLVFKTPVTISPTTTIRFGIGLGSITSVDFTNGFYFEIVGNSLVGKTAASSVRSSSSAYTIATNTWYHLRVIATSTTLITYYVYDMDGTLLFSTTLNTNLPTTTVVMNNIVVATNSGIVSTILGYFDLISITFPSMVRGALN